MNEEIIEIEAESLELAKEQLKHRVKEGLWLISERIISGEKRETGTAEADTVAEARNIAEREMSPYAHYHDCKMINSPIREVITVEAFDKQSAEAIANSEAKQRFGNDLILRNLKLTRGARKGILGLGKRPNSYEIEIYRQARVEVTYTPKITISARIEKQLTLEQMIETLKSKDKDLVIVKLSQTNPIELTLEQMKELLQSKDNDIRGAAIVNLSQMSSTELTLEQLIELLKSEYKDVRNAVVVKLSQMNSAELVAISGLLVEPLVRAAWDQHKYDKESRTAIKVLVSLGESVIPQLLEMVNKDNHDCISCIALARIGDPATAPKARTKLAAHIMQEHVKWKPVSTMGLCSEEWKARHAITAMIQIGDEYVVDFLRLVALKTHPLNIIRSAAAYALGMIGDKRAIPDLTEALQDEYVQSTAKSALSKLEA